MKLFAAIVLSAFCASVVAADPQLIRFGHGFAAEEQLWLMGARPDLTPHQGKTYKLQLVKFQGNPEHVLRLRGVR